MEVKRGTLYRDAIVQALNCASSIASMPTAKLREVVEAYLAKHGDVVGSHPAASVLAASEEGETRDVAVVVVGTGRDASLDRLAGFLGQTYNVPIQVVTFEVFAIGDGRELLVREVTEAEAPGGEAQGPAAERTVEAVFARAERWNALDRFEPLYDAAMRNGLYARPSIHSIMYAPPNNKTRMLFTAWVRSNDGAIVVYVSPDAFAEFFSVTSEEAVKSLGPEGYRTIASREEAVQFGSTVEALIERARERQESGPK